MFDIGPIRDCGTMHYLTGFINIKRDIWSSNGKVLKGPDNASLGGGIIKFGGVSKFRKQIGIRGGFGLVHISFLKNG